MKLCVVTAGTALCLVLALFPNSALADTDVYGNEIKTYTESGVQKTYQFWVSGEKAEDASLARKSSNSYTYASSLEARSKSVLSVCGKVASTVWTGLLLFIR